MSTLWRLAPLAVFLALAGCTPAPTDDPPPRLSASDRAQQVGRDVGAMVEGMRRAGGFD